MSTYKAIAEAFDEIAAAIVDVADAFRSLEPEPDDDEARRRELARERTRRYRARRAADAAPIYPDSPRHRDVARDVTKRDRVTQNFDNSGAPSRRPTVREDGRRDDGEPVTRVTSDATSATRPERDADGWREPSATEDERELARSKVRELGDQLRRTREARHEREAR